MTPAKPSTSSFIRVLLWCAAMIAVCVAAAAPAGAEVRGSDLDEQYAADRVIVRFDGQESSAERREIAAGGDARLGKHLGAVPGLFLLELRDDQEVDEAVSELNRVNGVRYAEPDYASYGGAVPTDSRFGEQWGFENTGQTVYGWAGVPDADIDATEAWDLTTGSDDVTVGVIDTGVAYDHPDLAPNAWTNPGETGGGKETNGVDDDGNGYVDDVHGWDFRDRDNDPYDLNFHGTFIAGIIAGAANNDGGPGATDIAGLNWDASVMALRTGDANATAGLNFNSDVIDAIGYAGQNGVDVLNYSVGGFGFSVGMRDAIQAVPDILFVTIAHNFGTDVDQSPIYPCAYDLPNILCVAASDQDDQLASFSGFGDTQVDLAAPGVNILSSDTARETLAEEDFEAPLSGRWLGGGTPDLWERTSARSASGSFSVTDSPGGDYSDNTANFIRNDSPFDLSGWRHCSAAYSLALETESGFDQLSVEATRSPGTEPWTRLRSWSGGPDFFQLYGESLESFSGDADVYLRFRLTSDPSYTQDGAYIDDVLIRCQPPAFSALSFEIGNGTSYAGPQVAGVAALILSVDPDAAPADIRQAILSGVDLVPGLDGKVASDGRLNAHGALLAAADAPKTSIDSGPATGSITDDPTPTFDFSSSEPGSEFECRVDGAPLAPCDRPHTTAALADGPHTFAVRAIDAAGNIDATPEKRDFVVDAPEQVSPSPGPDPGSPAPDPDPSPGPDPVGGDLPPEEGGTNGPDVLEGTGLADLINGLGGPDLIRGGDGDDLIRGSRGPDKLDGGPGNDTVFGGRGRDEITANDGERDTISCGRNVDTVIADDRDDLEKNCERVL